MTTINKVTVSGFRGILAPFTLNFLKGNSLRSMVIYGRNGTGKSSITDAWEWFHTEKINHLAREGAGPSSFPHKNAKPGESYVEIDFKQKSLGTVRINYDHNRVTKPDVSGNINQFRQLAPHPCHIRFEDLTRFVYLTKTERFDALAQLMGFTPQVDLQKSLRRVSRKLKDETESSTREQTSLSQQLCETLGITQINEGILLNLLNNIFIKHNIERVDIITDVSKAVESLTKQVENDPRAKELSDLKQLDNQISELVIPTDLITIFDDYCEAVRSYASLESEVSDLLMLGLYEQADEIFGHLKEQGESVEVCPLCKNHYEGDLHAHIKAELDTLKQLKQYRDDLKLKRKILSNTLPKRGNLSKMLKKITDEINKNTKCYVQDELISLTRVLETSIDKIWTCIGVQIDHIKMPYAEELIEIKINLKEHNDNLKNTREQISTNINGRVDLLEKDESRKILVTDQADAKNGFNLWTKLQTVSTSLDSLNWVTSEFDGIVDNFVKSNINNVQSRFDVISTDVQKYFSILEQDTKGLGKPKLKLLPNEDRAVELQVEFHGEPVYPAYRFLSESQLNSFGLVIFLASAKYFNKEFRFLILDDVINSFDGYKRPKVIDILKQELSDHQILLLTHDNVWCDRLFDVFPTWGKRRFIRHEIGVGPIDTEGYSQLEIIEQSLENDEATRAGRDLGPFLEKHLQELCEAFEALVKYNQRNEYPLDPLLDRFRVRVKEKLGKDHDLFNAIGELQSESGFRNLCAHWKNPDIELTRPEMEEVVRKWKSIAKIIRCQEESCYKYVRYDGKSDFVCECGATRLVKV